jgi:hypothetical protein
MMDREQIIQWAREAGFMLVTKSDPETGGWYECFDDELEALAKLVAAHEREALLDLVDNYAKNNTDLKAAIRARK